MLQKVFQAVILQVPEDVKLAHKLFVGIEKRTLDDYGMIHLNPSSIQKQLIGALIRDYPILHNSFDCEFIQMSIIESDGSLSDLSLSMDTIPLYVTEEFLNVYNYSFDDICYFKLVKCFPLDKIVIGSKSTDSFTLFQDQINLIKRSCVEKVLCRRSDIVFIPNFNNFNCFDMIALDCQPFLQGIWNLKSSLIIADMRDMPERLNPRKLDVFDDTALLNLISYTSRNFLGVNIPPTTVSSYSVPLNMLKASLSYEIHVIPKMNRDFEKELKNFKEIDCFNTVFMSFKCSKKFPSIQNGSWVKIYLNQGSLKNKRIFPPHQMIFRDIDSKFLVESNARLAQICFFTNKKVSSKYFPSDEMVYVSPHLWFNINSQPSLLIQPRTRLSIEVLDPSFTIFAKEAYAALIQSPNYDGKIICNTMLTNFFNIPRYVCKGDILSLCSRDQLDFHSHIQDEEVEKLKWPVVHFRINMIDGPSSPYGYLISNKHTRLYQCGTKQFYVPITMETYYQLSSYHPIWSAVPNGLASYINELQDLILPFLKLQNEKCKINSNILFYGPPCSGKTTVVKAVSRCLNLHLYKVNCHELTGETSSAIESRLNTKIGKGSSYTPCIILLKNIHCIGKEKEPAGEDSRVINALSSLLKNANSYSVEYPIIVIGTAPSSENLSRNLVSAFLHSIHMQAPNEEERFLLLKDLLTTCDVSNDVSVRFLAQRTAGFVLGDLCALVDQAIRNAYGRIKKFSKDKKLNHKEEEDIILASVPIIQRDLLKALEELHSKFADAIGAPKIPNVKFEDIGGLADVKQEILDTIQLPLEHPEILFSGLRRSGVLLYGPPGSGKTLLAKAVATECSLNFLSVKGPELINMYVGQSEENVRAVFQQARSAVPCIIFFDELDSLAPNRGRSGDSGGVMDRVVSQLLAELDGLNKKSEVFVIGATNRPDLLDPALLRPGRFDRLLYVGIPEDMPSKLSILGALTKKFPVAANVNLKEIVEKCPPHLSGADFYSLCSNAVIRRVEENVKLLENGDQKIEDICNDVTTEDFLGALQSLVPSVSPEQYKQYQQIRASIENK